MEVAEGITRSRGVTINPEPITTTVDAGQRLDHDPATIRSWGSRYRARKLDAVVIALRWPNRPPRRALSLPQASLTQRRQLLTVQLRLRRGIDPHNASKPRAATLSGRIAFFSVADKALAPLGVVALAQAVGYTWVMSAVGAVCVTAALSLVAYHRV